MATTRAVAAACKRAASSCCSRSCLIVASRSLIWLRPLSISSCSPSRISSVARSIVRLRLRSFERRVWLAVRCRKASCDLAAELDTPPGPTRPPRGPSRAFAATFLVCAALGNSSCVLSGLAGARVIEMGSGFASMCDLWPTAPTKKAVVAFFVLVFSFVTRSRHHDVTRIRSRSTASLVLDSASLSCHFAACRSARAFNFSASS
mmetsp:Transcript_34304/g.90672  ORF Transcript_34304/g.90672 Transcript_34304/m.90672 type:complete len:205 (-) Transcript_34304:4007-4621(-)